MKVPSGKFVLRILPALHAKIRSEASERGISLNEWCGRALEHYLDYRHQGPVLRDPENEWVRHASAVVGDDLIGLVLFGSSARGEATANSDIDLLVVTAPTIPLRRRLYAAWDSNSSDLTVNPHFVHVPDNVLSAGSLWYEVAIDGIILLEQRRQITDFLRKIRTAIADRTIERKDAYGHAYWIKHRPEAGNAE